MINYITLKTVPPRISYQLSLVSFVVVVFVYAVVVDVVVVVVVYVDRSSHLSEGM